MAKDSLGSLSRQILKVAREKNISLSLAESCTGGMVAGYITDIAGASAYFKGGYIVYSDEMKTNILGVSPDIIGTYGAVSENTAAAMALRCLKKIGSKMALAVTGIAGPDGGNDAKPVGTVCFAVAWYSEIKSSEHAIDKMPLIECHTFKFDGAREQIRLAACEKGLRLVLRKMESI